MHTLDGGRIGIAAQGVGIAQAAMDCAVHYAKGTFWIIYQVTAARSLRTHFWGTMRVPTIGCTKFFRFFIAIEIIWWFKNPVDCWICYGYSAETRAILLKALDFQDLFDVGSFFRRKVSKVAVIVNWTMETKSCCWCPSKNNDHENAELHSNFDLNFSYLLSLTICAGKLKGTSPFILGYFYLFTFWKNSELITLKLEVL